MEKRLYWRYVAALLFASMIIVGCKKDRFEDEYEEEEETTSYTSLYVYSAQKQPEQSKTITFEDTCCGPIMVGVEGTKIWLHSNLFQLANGDSLKVPYDIMLIELYPVYDMLYYGQPALDGETPLETAAQIKVRILKDGEECMLRSGKGYAIELDVTNGSADNSDMLVYYGETSVDVTRWTNDVSTLDASISPDNISAVYTDSTGYLLSIARLDWVSCSRAYTTTGASSAIAFTTDLGGSEFIDIWVGYSDINSLTKATSLVTTSIPVGTNVEFVATALDQDGTPVMHNSTETITAGHTVALNLSTTTSETIVSTVEGL